MKFGRSFISPFWGDIVIGKHKSFEYQIEFSKNFTSVFPGEFNFNIARKQDHAGISLEFSVYRLFWVMLQTYDHRHWDKENNCWFGSDKIF